MSDASQYTVHNLHWLPEHPLLADDVSVQLEINHPSNTSKEQNPFYVMTGRSVGKENPGKWHQHELTSPGYNSLRKREVWGLTAEQRLEIWCERIHEILRNSGPFVLSNFATLWSSAYPDVAIEWYKPKGFSEMGRFTSK